jgi:hypothetical protein
MKTKEYDFRGFTRVLAKSAMNIEVTKGDSYVVSITGEDTVVDRMEVSVEVDRLALDYKRDLVSFFAIPFARATARITLPDLREMDMEGAAHATVKGFKSRNDFAIVLSGATRIELNDIAVGNMKCDVSGASRMSGDIKATGNVDMRISGAGRIVLKGYADDLEIDASGASRISGDIKASGNVDMRISGASRIDLKGYADDLEIDASGASGLELDEFKVHNAKVKLSGASRSAVSVNARLDVALEGASKLDYGGDPTMGDVRVVGASSLIKK